MIYGAQQEHSIELICSWFAIELFQLDTFLMKHIISFYDFKGIKFDLSKLLPLQNNLE